MPKGHPSVIFINAITSPQRSEQICYPDEAAAFDAMVTYRPFNNTMLSPVRCDQVHCPHGCVHGGTRTRPVKQEQLTSVIFRDGKNDAVPTGRWRCPKCHTEYTRGETPAVTAGQLARDLVVLGLADVKVGRYGSWPVVVSGVFPPGNRDAAGWIVRVAESSWVRAETSTRDRLSEPFWMGLFKPDAAGWVTTPVEQWERLTLPQIRAGIAGFM